MVDMCFLPEISDAMTNVFNEVMHGKDDARRTSIHSPLNDETTAALKCGVCEQSV
jgi:hypothetical protein